MEAAEEQGLPALQGRQGTAAVAMVKALQPGRFEVRAIEAEVVEGIGNRPTQLPERPVEGLPVRSPFEPAGQQGGAVACHQFGQELQQWPDQVGGTPGIGPAGIVAQQMVDDLAEVAAGKGKAQVGGDAAQFDGQLFAQPATGGPGVDYHLHRLPGARRIEKQLLGQHAGKEFGPVAAEDRQQRPEVRSRPRRSALGSKAASSLRSTCSLPGTLKLAPVSGQ